MISSSPPNSGAPARSTHRVGAWAREHANLQTILPVIVALGMLAYVASVAAAPRSATELWTVFQQTWVIVLVLTFPYLAARAMVWYRLMTQLGIRVPIRQAAVSFAGGEVTKSLPGGVYVQNYILGRLGHFERHSLIRSSMATTATLGLESCVALPIAVIVGVPGESWVRWVLVGVVAMWVAALVVAHLFVHRWTYNSRPRPGRLGQGAAIAEEFFQAGGELLSVPTILDLIPTALYMFVYVIDLYVILRALGIHNVSLLDTMGIYSVIVLAVILVPIPTEIGITEFTGLGILLTYGIPQSTAAVAVLSLRILATGLNILIAGLLLFLLRGELRTSQPANLPAASAE